MKHVLKILSALFILLFTACEALGVLPQSTVPVQTELNSTPTSTPELPTFPQMTETALAFPTVPFVIEPTQTPALPNKNELVITSPDGKYAVACQDPFLILFDTQRNEIISTYTPYIYDCEQQVHWSPDGAYATFATGYDSILRWRPDGSQPDLLHINMPNDPLYLGCDVRMAWSPDGRFLAIDDCGIYVIRPFDDTSFQNPLLVEESGYYDFRWVTPRLLMLEYHRVYGFYNVLDNGTGRSVGWWDKDGLGCLAQAPLISPDERWVVFDVSQYQCGISGPSDIYQYSLVDLEQASIQIFSNTSGNLIDFISWSNDSREFYFISRPIDRRIMADPRTPFGLLAINPQTLQVHTLFEQAQFAAFNEDLTWAYVVFPARNDDGSRRFDGGLWQVGSSDLKGRQIMFYGEPEEGQFLSQGSGSMYSAAGLELAYSSNMRTHPLPAFWSHDNTRVALVNVNHELVVISLNGEIQVLGKLGVSENWLYPAISWSEDDKTLQVGGIPWSVP